MIHPYIQARIDSWINQAPEARRIESVPLANDAWETKAIEDGRVVYEEVDLETDAPLLNLLALWCERQETPQPRPLAKAKAAPDSDGQLRTSSSRQR